MRSWQMHCFTITVIPRKTFSFLRTFSVHHTTQASPEAPESIKWYSGQCTTFMCLPFLKCLLLPVTSTWMDASFLLVVQAFNTACCSQSLICMNLVLPWCAREVANLCDACVLCIPQQQNSHYVFKGQQCSHSFWCKSITQATISASCSGQKKTPKQFIWTMDKPYV